LHRYQIVQAVEYLITLQIRKVNRMWLERKYHPSCIAQAMSSNESIVTDVGANVDDAAFFR
jgi:hypothetical protein